MQVVARGSRDLAAISPRSRRDLAAISPRSRPQEISIYQTCYVVFGFLWTWQFFVAIEIATISGCVVYYYFIDMDTAGRKDERYEDNQTDFVVSTMLAHILRCNLGTMAMDSFILACIEVSYKLRATSYKLHPRLHRGAAPLPWSVACPPCEPACSW